MMRGPEGVNGDLNRETKTKRKEDRCIERLKNKVF